MFFSRLTLITNVYFTCKQLVFNPTIKNDDGFYKQTNVVLLRILFKEENRARSLQTTKKKFTCLNKLK